MVLQAVRGQCRASTKGFQICRYSSLAWILLWSWLCFTFLLGAMAQALQAWLWHLLTQGNSVRKAYKQKWRVAWKWSEALLNQCQVGCVLVVLDHCRSHSWYHANCVQQKALEYSCSLKDFSRTERWFCLDSCNCVTGSKTGIKCAWNEKAGWALVAAPAWLSFLPCSYLPNRVKRICCRWKWGQFSACCSGELWERGRMIPVLVKSFLFALDSYLWEQHRNGRGKQCQCVP